ncbi:hypothetical protein JD844_023840, partial [Phrynosoma platyrhinos]
MKALSPGRPSVRRGSLSEPGHLGILSRGGGGGGKASSVGAVGASLLSSSSSSSLEDPLSLLYNMNDCYSKLKELVPSIPQNKKVSKMEILQHVIDYILDLQIALDTHPAAALVSLHHPRTTTSPQAGSNNNAVSRSPLAALNTDITILSIQLETLEESHLQWPPEGFAERLHFPNSEMTMLEGDTRPKSIGSHAPHSSAVLMFDGHTPALKASSVTTPQPCNANPWKLNASLFDHSPFLALNLYAASLSLRMSSKTLNRDEVAVPSLHFTATDTHAKQTPSNPNSSGSACTS